MIIYVLGYLRSVLLVKISAPEKAIDILAAVQWSWVEIVIKFT